MRPEANPPPVSGEIVTAGTQWARTGVDMRAAADRDVVDAEFETVSSHSGASPTPSPSRLRLDTSPPLRGGEEPQLRRSAFPESPPAGLDMLRSQDKEKMPQRGGPAFWLFGLATAAAAFWISGGHMLFDMSAILSPGGPPGLRVASVESRVEPGPQPVLYVEADLVNDGAEALALPPIGIDVVDGEGRTRRYLLGTSGGTVAAGESFGFSSRLIAPKSGVDKVSVSFGAEE